MSPEDQRDITVPSTLLRPAAITLLNPEDPLSSTKKYFKKIPRTSTSVTFKMTAIAFALNPLMSGDEALKEMHAQIAASNSSNKATMQAILVVVMSYERICSIARADGRRR
jgi:hypothetical protein